MSACGFESCQGVCGCHWGCWGVLLDIWGVFSNFNSNGNCNYNCNHYANDVLSFILAFLQFSEDLLRGREYG